MSLNMLQQVELRGVTKNDIQEIYDSVAREFKSRIFFIDASYLYTFHLDDFPEIKKFNMLGRYYADKLRTLNPTPQAIADNSIYCRAWHTYLESWLDGEYVVLGGKRIKPIQITRSLDRVVNQGMGLVSDFICGIGTAKAFNCRALGDGALDSPDDVSLADTRLEHQVDIIDVNTTPEGGSLSTDGTTIYSVGNHSKETVTPDNEEFTECGMFDSTASTKKMLDHSVFVDPIEHRQNEDAPGSTTVIYLCSG